MRRLVCRLVGHRPAHVSVEATTPRLESLLTSTITGVVLSARVRVARTTTCPRCGSGLGARPVELTTVTLVDPGYLTTLAAAADRAGYVLPEAAFVPGRRVTP